MKWDPLVSRPVGPGVVADPGRASCPMHLIDFALREADRMTILASEARQLGFREVERHLKAQAAGARAWALRGAEP